MRRFLLHIALMALVAAFPASAQPAGPEWAPLPQALSTAAAGQRPALVYVRAPWCAPCRRLERETFADARIASRLARFARARLTIDERDRTHRVADYRLTEAEWAARMGAHATPTIVLLGPDGQVLGRHTGFLPAEGLLPILDAALEASAEPPTP